MSFTPARSNWRDVGIAATAKALTNCGDFLAATTLGLALQSGGDDGVGVAALLIAAALPLAVFGTLGGRLADRWDSRAVVVTTATVQAVICVVLSTLDKPVAIVGLVALLACGTALSQPALSALTPEMVTAEDLPRAMSIGQTAATIGMLAGPALGGLFVGAFGTRVPLLLDAASLAVLAVAGLLIQARRGGRRTAAAPVLAPSGGDPAPGAPAIGGVSAAGTAAAAGGSAEDAAARWRLRHDPVLRAVLGSISAVIATVMAMGVAEVFFVRETLHSSAFVYGLVSSVWTAGMLVGAWPAARLRRDDVGMARLQLVILAVLSVIVTASAAVPSAGWLIPLYAVGGALNGALNVVVGVVVIRRVPPAVRGRVSGLFNAASAGASLVGYLVGGVLLPVLTPRSLIAGAGAVSLVVALGFLVAGVTWAARRTVPAAVPVGVD